MYQQVVVCDIRTFYVKFNLGPKMRVRLKEGCGSELSSSLFDGNVDWNLEVAIRILS